MLSLLGEYIDQICDESSHKKSKIVTIFEHPKKFDTTTDMGKIRKLLYDHNLCHMVHKTILNTLDRHTKETRVLKLFFDEEVPYDVRFDTAMTENLPILFGDNLLSFHHHQSYARGNFTNSFIIVLKC